MDIFSPETAARVEGAFWVGLGGLIASGLFAALRKIIKVLNCYDDLEKKLERQASDMGAMRDDLHRLMAAVEADHRHDMRLELRRPYNGPPSSHT